MIAYNQQGLDNRTIRDEAGKALGAGCINPEEGERIGTAYPELFYTPNHYIRIGMFIVTVIIVVFFFGLLMLMGGMSGNTFEGLMIVVGILCLGVLELFVNHGKHFQSGVDDALMWMSAGLLAGGIDVCWTNGSTPEYLAIVFVIAFGFMIRFADRVMAVAVFASLLAIVFTFFEKLGWSWTVISLFLGMAFSLAIFSICGRVRLKDKYRHYRYCVDFVRGAALIAFYLCGNYYVIGQMAAERNEHAGLFLRVLFWALTLLTPLAYIIIGLRRKDRLFLDIGLLLIAAAIFTIRYYYHFLPVEWAITIGGLVLIGLAYSCIRYLKQPQKGFTLEPDTNPHFVEALTLEALVIAETFKPAMQPQPGDDLQFGGGSGGGGGAGGEF